MSAVPHPSSFAEDDRIYTFEEFIAMNFEGRAELIEGKIVEMGWNNLTHTGLGAWLSRILGNWAEETNWGLIFGADAGVRTKKNPDTTRGADIACVSFNRYDDCAVVGKVFEKGPELLVEITSPSNTWDDLQTKIFEYFAVGTDEVWVISPDLKIVTVYETPTASLTFSADNKDVVKSKNLPGFELSLEEMAAKLEQITKSAENDSSES